ncbi:helix-turn-helix transcriptional regulator [Paenibacillus hamazuiensis]|uniref:helix-turn-helix transcriptional regulator n=1 Tax=Paenibacillus hamazuiensis TaxID=2936508 RepID=UPI00200D708E|nr:AraC family transcriptional regulator [Paenibacillus hamazuiensis]
MDAADFRHYFNLFFDGLELRRNAQNRTEEMKLRSRIGSGTVRRFVPRGDLEVALTEFTLCRQRQVNIPGAAAMVELSYCFQGTRETSVSSSRFEIVPGSCTLQFIDQAEACLEFAKDESFRMLGIGIPVATFQRFMEDAAGGSRTVDFYRILGDKRFRVFQEKIDPAASVIVNRIMRSAGSPGITNFELECGVLELLSLAFRTFLQDGIRGAARLTKREMEKIRQARDILLERMTEPPSLIELSRLVGMNDCKLKLGFKEIYGNTVFGYLREKRLEKAYRLLQMGAVNVLEASCAVGYSNPSHFAETFREKYGVNPGELVRFGRVRP